MRPTRLEISGFTSFRETTVVDFEGADYFVLVGPTGSGKSTIIDAICFALYGSVPRYDNRNLVAPVVTQGQLEARVRLDFEISGEAHTVVRVVKKQGRNTSTKAQLQKGDEVLAGTSDEVTEKVAELIGLSFEHFIKCVVLPQGEFSRFLHDKPATRQDMLVRLLGLDIYERMRARASAITSELKNQVVLLEQRLEEDMAFATTDALESARGRVKQLESLRKKVGDSMPTLNELQRKIDTTDRETSEIHGYIEQLLRLAMPPTMEEFGDRVAHAEKTLNECREALNSCEATLAVALKAKEGMPEKAPLLVAQKAHRDRVALAERIAGERAEVDEATSSETTVRRAFEMATEAVAAAETAVIDARDAHAAQHLAAGLRVDEPCPVCLQVVAKLPKHPRAKAIDSATKAADKARKVLRDATTALADRSTQRTKHETALASLTEQLNALDELLRKQPDATAIEASLTEIEQLEAAEATARAAESEARKELATAQRAESDLKDVKEAEQKRFDEARDPLIHLEPPRPAREDLVSDWEQLIAWSTTQVPNLEKQVAASEKLIDGLRSKMQAQLDSLADSCIECEIELEEQDEILEVVLDHLADAKHEADETAKAIEASKKLRADLKSQTTKLEVASGMARHLNASGFERWIVDSAVTRLVEGASAILGELAGGQYSLSVDGHGNFIATDHHNANETRSAKTLSGGETFLASLSLALALSDQLMDLAAEGSARLDAIFLDEGFGTLDPETLDTVAATIENLSAGGRMVGIVTHVRDLADRVPFQFRVTKDAKTSRVEKVIA